MNIFYEIGSIVRLPEFSRTGNPELDLPYKLEISNTIFRNMSFCGSIVSNDWPIFAGTHGSYIMEYMSGIKNQINSFYEKTLSQKILLDCSSAECFKFSFVNNTVDNLNQMKRSTPINFFDRHVNW